MQIVTATHTAAPAVIRSKTAADSGRDFDEILRFQDAAGESAAADLNSAAPGDDQAVPSPDPDPDSAQTDPSGLELAPVQGAASSPDLKSLSGQDSESTARPIPSQPLSPTHTAIFMTDLSVTAGPDSPPPAAAILADPDLGAALPLAAAPAFAAATQQPGFLSFAANGALQTPHLVDQSPVPPTDGESGAPSSGMLAKEMAAATQNADTSTLQTDKTDPRLLPDKGRDSVAIPGHISAPDGGRPVALPAHELPLTAAQIASGIDPNLGPEVQNLFRDIAGPQSLPTSNGQIVRPDGSFAPPSQQIAQAIVRMGANGPVELALNPAELGQVRFEMTTTGDKLHITLFVERPDAMDLIRRNGEQLLVDLRLSGFNNPSLSFGDWSQRDQRGAQPSNPTQGAEPEGQSAQIGSSLALVHHAAASGRLDMRL